MLCQLPMLQPVRRLLNRLIAAAMLMITVRDKAHDTAPDTFALDKTSNNEKFYATLSINGIYIPARCDSALKAQVNVMGDQRHLGSIALQKKANATLVRNKQGSTLLPNVFIKGKSNKQCCSLKSFHQHQCSCRNGNRCVDLWVQKPLSAATRIGDHCWGTHQHASATQEKRL